MFYRVNGEIFNSILRVESGEWLISYSNPISPIFVRDELLEGYQKIEVPKEYLQNIELEEYRTDAQQKRFDMILPLLKDNKYILNKKKRAELSAELAKKHLTTKRRILKLYYKYLAKRSLIEIKQYKSRDDEKYSKYIYAIKKYYFSAKKFSLRSTYDMMLLEFYMHDDGTLHEDYPTWDSFRHYFYDNNYNKSSQKSISRDGLTHYQRNERPLYGSVMTWKKKLGYFQMDATEADLYLTSRFDKSTIIGRPNIYMAVDTITQLICGIYVGLDADESAVIACLANAATDKVKYCKQFGIDITADKWPCKGLPRTIITDQGLEFTSKRAEELCHKYGLDIETLPPFRPDEKSLVEKTFDILQTRFKPLLRGKGVIEPDSQERWSTDYRGQAVLNLDEFTRIIIHCVIYINSGRLLENYVPSAELLKNEITLVPSELWMWYELIGKSDIIPVNEQDIYHMSLIRKTVKLNRKGIFLNGFWYKNNNMNKLLHHVGINKPITIAYDKNNISKVYMVFKGEYIEFLLPNQYSEFTSLNTTECEAIHDSLKKQKKEFRESQTNSRVQLLKQITEIVNINESDDRTSKTRLKGEKIRENRMEEKGKMT